MSKGTVYELKKRATRYLAQELSSGKPLSVNDMAGKVMWNFGLNTKFVLEFLENYKNAIVEEPVGFYEWKT